MTSSIYRVAYGLSSTTAFQGTEDMVTTMFFCKGWRGGGEVGCHCGSGLVGRFIGDADGIWCRGA